MQESQKEASPNTLKMSELGLPSKFCGESGLWAAVARVQVARAVLDG